MALNPMIHRKWAMASNITNETIRADFPQIEWCFDMEFYYDYLDQNGERANNMSQRIKQYKNFSFRVNGILSLVLMMLGFIGNIMLVTQIRRSRVFSYRLAVHLSMLCVWDSLLLLSCLLTYCIPSLMNGLTWHYGPIAYVLFIFQPLASACVHGTVWQVMAITLERYLAVTRPLEQRTRKAQFGVRIICLTILILVAILNLLPVPFDRVLVDCFEIKNGSTPQIHTALRPYNEDETWHKIGMLLRVIPDFFFRAPVPIIIIAILTVKTIQVCNQRYLMPFPVNPRQCIRNTIPLRLSLLSFKIILCNSLYMFNAILIEILGIGRSDLSNDDGSIDHYMNSFYLSDASNMLLVVQSATNWLIFFHWPRFTPRSQSDSFSASTSYTMIYPSVAAQVLKRFSPVKERVGAEIVTALCIELPQISELVVDRSPFSKGTLTGDEEKRISRLGAKLGAFIELGLKWFADRTGYSTLRDECRKAGAAHFETQSHLTADQWKLVRAVVVRSLLVNTVKRSNAKDSLNTTQIEESLTRAFNFVLAETRSGTLCASVEANQKMKRSRSSSVVGWSRGGSVGIEKNRPSVTRPLMLMETDD